MLQDMIQFGTIFAVFLFSFSGAFYLALRGEERGSRGGSRGEGRGNATNGTLEEVAVEDDEDGFTTNLDLYPHETS